MELNEIKKIYNDRRARWETMGGEDKNAIDYLLELVESQQQEIKQKDKALEQASNLFNNITRESDPKDMYDIACGGLDIVDKALGGNEDEGF